MAEMENFLEKTYKAAERDLILFVCIFHYG